MSLTAFMSVVNVSHITNFQMSGLETLLRGVGLYSISLLVWFKFLF